MRQDDPNIPAYTEKKAIKQTNTNSRGQMTMLSKVRISIEPNSMQNSFLNIVKSEEQSQRVVNF